ncbi:unnamed protein product [Macrosiphum euphorbiae]|uniref:Uncharacterized protein n=1 Tax=Macrosiphum euphorbiae TaxID=13131 RepID=A0AAV0WRH9_9HEMI|nr:unnamed protein product [Macrosiphum euphorbiae]
MHLVFGHDAQQWYDGLVGSLDLPILMWVPDRVERVFDSCGVAKGFEGLTGEACAAVADNPVRDAACSTKFVQLVQHTRGIRRTAGIQVRELG